MSGAWLKRALPSRRGAGCVTPPHTRSCPICPLLAETEENAASIAALWRLRVFTIKPPLGDGLIAPGGERSFGLTVFGEPGSLLPHLPVSAFLQRYRPKVSP